MAWTKTNFGAIENGAEVPRYTSSNENGVSVSFMDLSGTWLTIVVLDRDGHLDGVVLGYDTVERCTDLGGHLGEIVDRNVNRIGRAEFTLNRTAYTPEQSSGRNNLHSGSDYYHDHIRGTKAEETGLGAKITFSLFSLDGDQGYPDNTNIIISYTPTPDNGLKPDYYVVADVDIATNFTNHSYFNLARHQSGPVMAQQVWVDADTFTVVDKTSILAGGLVSVEEAPMNLTTMEIVEWDINVNYESSVFIGGYDHNWVLDHPRDELTPLAKACDEESGHIAEAYTDLPGVQFYTANSFGGAGKDSTQYTSRCGYCLETRYLLDAISKPGFPSPALKAGEEYQTIIIYKFLTDK